MGYQENIHTLKRIRRLVLWAVCCGIYILNANGQQNSFKNFGEYEGLTNTIVQCLAQDSTGYMWIGTSNGLYWYDGQYFDVCNHDSSDSTSIAEDNITCLYVDSDKKSLWVGTNFGILSKLNTKTFEFENFQRKNGEAYDNGISSVYAIYRYKNYVFKGTKDKGLQIFNLETNGYADVLIDQHCNYTVNDIHRVGSVLYVATSQGVYNYDLSLTENLDAKKQELTHFGSEEHIRSISSLNDTELLYHTKYQLVRCNRRSFSRKIIYEVETGQNTINAHFVDDHQQIWIGTEGNGLIKVSSDGQKLSHFIADDNSETLVNNWVKSVAGSRCRRLLWVGTKDGLSMLNLSEARFKQFPVKSNNDESEGNLFFLLKHSTGSYWYWSQEGLFCSKTGEEFKPFMLTNNINTKDEIVWDGIENDNNEILLCTRNGLVKIDPKIKKTTLINFPDVPHGDKYYNYLTGIVRKDNDMWLSSAAGIIRYNETSHDKEFFPFPDEYKTNNMLKTSCLTFGRQGIVWIGDRNGYLLSLDTQTGEFNRYSTSLETTTGSISRHNMVLDILVYDDNELWLGTYGAGLLKFDIDEKKISAVSNIDQLNSNIYKIIQDKHGYIWMNTSSKIVRYDQEKNIALTYGRLDGTLCRDFNEGAAFCNADGDVLLGGFGGFVEFNVNRFNYNTYNSLVDINSYYADNEHTTKGTDVEYKLKHISKDTLYFNTGQKQISFYCSVLNFASSEKNLVSWKLEGHEEKWDTLHAYDYKVFVELPQGKYTLRAKGCNDDHVWSDIEDEIYIVVKPTFKDSVYYKAILLFVPALLVYLFFFIRTRYLRRKKDQLEMNVQERTLDLRLAYSELEDSREEILTQKAELERHRFYLEDLVSERTIDLEKAKEKAEASDRLKTSFLANLSHEIRTPMNSIVGFSALLASDIHSSEERKEFARMVQKSSDSLLVLINDIIDISRIETGQVQLYNKRFCLADISETAFKSVMISANNEEVDLLLNIDSIKGNCEMFSDAERIKQILINLLNNALKFTSEGYVQLSIFSKEDACALLGDKIKGRSLPNRYFMFVVKDTGIGIKREHHQHIFSPFQKVQEGDNFHDGIGLGLSIVKNLIELLGGNIWLESESGKGTSFYFYLPVDTIN